MAHGYRNFIRITREEFKKALHKIKSSEIKRQKLGNRYARKVKAYYKNDMVFYLYGEIKDPKAVKVKIKEIEYYLNPKYKYLLEDETTVVMMIREDLVCNSMSN